MSRRRSHRKTAISACALLCIAGLVVTIGWFRLAGSALPTRGSVRVPGILHPVDIQLDTFGVPYVTARAETDLVRALGYLHATDRMWQMEFFRRVAAGRLAELFGRDLVDTDRLLRTLDLWGAAEHAAANLDPAERVGRSYGPVLIEPDPKQYTERGRFTQPDRTRLPAWSHPVIANGKLYIRDQETLFCYDVKAK